MAAWYAASASGRSDRGQVAMAMGRIGRAHPEPVSRAARRAVVRARLVSTDLPAALQVTALDADTGELHVFAACCGVSLLGAVAASGAVSGVWPLERFAGRFWIDGGMVSAANAHLASGYGRVVVIAPVPDEYSAIPGAAQDITALSAHARVLLVAPDERSVAAVGLNIYDPARRGAAAAAGRA